MFGKELRRHCSCNSHDLLVNVWNCSSPVIDFLSGYEDLVSSGSDHFTLQGNMRLREVLTEHVVDIHKVLVDFRDASERIQSSSLQTLGVNRLFSPQSFVMLNTKSFMNGFMRPTSKAARFYSTRTILSLTSASNRSTIMTRGGCTRSYCRRRTWMGFTRRTVTCLFSLYCSRWSVSLHRTIVTHQQCFCEEERYCQEHYSDSSCDYDFSRH